MLSQEEQFWWNWGVQAVVGVGTLAAVVVALFGDWVKAKLFRPQLYMTLLDEAGKPTPVRLEYEGVGRIANGRYYHGRVANRRRWPPATQVQVVLSQVEEKGLDDSWETRWTGAAHVRWVMQETRPITATIGPHADFDVCSIVEDKWVSLHLLAGSLDLEPFTRRRSPFDMRLTFEARSIEGDSPTMRVRITWDGGWAAGQVEMKKHLRVRVE